MERSNWKIRSLINWFFKDHSAPLAHSPVWKVRGFSQRLPGLCWRWWAVCGDNHMPKHCQSPDQSLGLARAKFHSLQTFRFQFGILQNPSEVLTEKRLHMDPEPGSGTDSNLFFKHFLQDFKQHVKCCGSLCLWDIVPELLCFGTFSKPLLCTFYRENPNMKMTVLCTYFLAFFLSALTFHSSKWSLTESISLCAQ